MVNIAYDIHVRMGVLAHIRPAAVHAENINAPVPFLLFILRKINRKILILYLFRNPVIHPLHLVPGSCPVTIAADKEQGKALRDNHGNYPALLL